MNHVSHHRQGHEPRQLGHGTHQRHLLPLLTYQQYLRQASLQAANDCISNAIAELPIFPHYAFDLDALYGAVDGQKFGVERPTVKER